MVSTSSNVNRTRLVAAARKLFAAHGYADVSVDEIAVAAGVTKGAVYYQFSDKTDLFFAACNAVLTDIAIKVATETMATGVNELDELVAGVGFLFDAYESPEARRLLLIDGPAVLGLPRWTAMHEGLRVGLAEDALAHLAEAGFIPKALVRTIADLLFGAFVQGVLRLEAANNSSSVKRQVREAYRTLVRGLVPTAKRRH